MKKKLIHGLLILACGLLLFLSCQKSDKDRIDQSAIMKEEFLSTITVTYERHGNPEVDPSMFGDHITLIETISLNDPVLLTYKGYPEWINFIAENADLNGVIKRYTFDNSPAQVIEIPLEMSELGESALIYTTSDTCLFAVGTLESLVNGK